MVPEGPHNEDTRMARARHRARGPRLRPSAPQSGLGIAGLAIFIIVAVVIAVVVLQLNSSPEAKYRAARPAYSTPAGTFNYFNQERAKYQKRTDPIDNLLACMAEDDARFFRVCKRPVSMSSEYGMTMAVASTSENEFAAFGVLTSGLPKPENTEIVRTYQEGDKAVIVWTDRKGMLSGSVPLILEGENWKIMDWFGWRFSEDSVVWYNTMESIEKDKLTPDEKLWADHYTVRKKDYEKTMQGFYASVYAPYSDAEGLDEISEEAAEWAAQQDDDPETAARKAFGNYISRMSRFQEDPWAEESVLDCFSQVDRAWFDRYFPAIAAIAGAQSSPAGSPRQAALRAILAYSPKTPNVIAVKTSGDRALIKTSEMVNGREETVNVCMIREDDGWKIFTLFFTRQTVWMPKIIQYRGEQGKPLTSEELDFQRNGKTQFEAEMREFYAAVGEPAA